MRMLPATVAGHRRLDGRLHVLGRQAEARRAARPPSADRASPAGTRIVSAGPAMTMPSKTSSTPFTPSRIPRDLAGAVLEQRLVLAEDVDVDRLRDAAGQVADVVLEQLPEVRVEGRGDRGGARADVRDHVLDVAPLARAASGG